MFVRHGETENNRLGLRCGGDLDIPLNARGREQAAVFADGLRARGLRPDCLIASDLLRNQQTAQIVAHRLEITDISYWPEMRERRLGQWNGQPIDLTEPWLRAGTAPPGGENEADFTARIAALIPRLEVLLPRQVLIVGSKGVARIMTKLCGHPLTTFYGLQSDVLENGDFTWITLPVNT